MLPQLAAELAYELPINIENIERHIILRFMHALYMNYIIYIVSREEGPRKKNAKRCFQSEVSKNMSMQITEFHRWSNVMKPFKQLPESMYAM